MNSPTDMTTPSEDHRDELEIAIRSYVTKRPLVKTKKPRRMPAPPNDPSEWTLVFDTETTSDHCQRLRFGSYEVRRDDDLRERGLFFDPDAMTVRETALLHRYAAAHGLAIMPVRQFVTDKLFAIAYQLDATIVGFNLPFDLSRIAVRAAPARGPMKGGFSFTLSEDPYMPRVQVKSLSQRAALIQFTATRERRDNRRMRRQKTEAPVRRGYFCDVKTLAAALLSGSFSLDKLAKLIGTPAQKSRAEEHGGPLTEDYIAYAVQDVATTWECYRVLRDKYRSYQLEVPLHRILSEASLGKAYLRQMGIRPWRKVQRNFPPELIGIVMSTYFGGRAEVRYRREIAQVLYCDFLSMYPTVCTLMGLWRYVIANGVAWADATKRTQAWLDRITEADLQRQTTWRKLTTLVQVIPDGEIFPVRAKYGNEPQATIGLNHLYSNQPLWFTLADCVAAKLLSGRTPRIVRAISFKPKSKQNGLRSVAIGGSDDFTVDPAKGDFYRSAIDQRTAVKTQKKKAAGAEAEALEAQQLAIKILANATSYGIFIELNVMDLEEPIEVECYSPSSGPFPVETQAVEQAGSFFHPLLATLITGAARLMLALAERKAINAGLNWCFCDTDSMALIKPQGMSSEQFFRVGKSVCDWFEPLNPYSVKGPLFKIEDANFDETTGALRPLMCLAISSKRYVLFSEAADGRPAIRKASLHGLGHLLPPYQRSDYAGDDSMEDLHALPDVLPWQRDLWLEIIKAAKGQKPEQVRLDFHPNMQCAAVSRYAVTTPSLHRMFSELNRGRNYAATVKPFNFLLALQANNIVWSPDLPPFPGTRRKIRNVTLPLKPIAPYSRNPQNAAATCFDRVSGQRIERHHLKTYRTALAQYHLRPELKFRNGDYSDRGFTERRHVAAVAIRHIGKEANRLEEQYFLGLQPEAQIDYGFGKNALDELTAELRDLVRHFGQRRAALDMGISRGTVGRLCRGNIAEIAPRLRHAIGHGLSKLRAARLEEIRRDRSLRQMINSEIADVGLTACAKWLGIDPSNLRKIAIGERGLSDDHKHAIERHFRERVQRDFGV